MSQRTMAPFGSWKSPITSDLIVAETIGLGGVMLDGEDVYWLEMRPREGGRYVLVRYTPDGLTQDVTPPPFNVYTRVHEYGGASYTVHNGVVYFTNFADQLIYRQRVGETPVPLTEDGQLRFADYLVDPTHNSLLAIREDHTHSDQHAVNTLVRVALDGTNEGQILAGGNDFYASPAISPDGQWLAWLTWNHPNMPWDGTELWVAPVQSDGTLGTPVFVAGGEEESVFQPSWSPEGILHFVSDRQSGWWNLYRWHQGIVEPLHPKAGEFGEPQWQFGMSTYGFDGTGNLWCLVNEQNIIRMVQLDSITGELMAVNLPYTVLSGIQVQGGRVAFIGGSAAAPTVIALFDTQTRRLEVLRHASPDLVDPGYLSIPETIEFPTTDGAIAHGFYYAPTNKDCTGPAGEKPPLLVFSHGGPTGASSAAYSLGIQFWTSRGFAVLDVNYRGSTGYGRAYRQALNGRWGIVDVDDCVAGALFLGQRGDVDEQRLAIRGGSAGGYTTLSALTFRQVFRAGASHFGVADLEALARETHKFESRYMDRLVGPYPERADLYRERSPIHAADKLSCPLIMFQGLDDAVVPPSQAEMMLAAARQKGLPVAYVPFAGEQHGFRQAKNIKRALDAELYFYGRIFKFVLADPVEPVEIENLAP
ncbi:MAG: S9 family peptidase [Candidatus Promineifilaceae bacterium]